MTFEDAVEFVLAEEGGYSDNPDDPGGETNFGISKRAYPSVDIKRLTRDEAIALYRRDYWDRCECDQLPPGLAFLVFDCAVNQGQNAAIRLLQRSLNVKIDGILGPVTRRAIARANEVNLIAEFLSRRLVAYGNLATFNRFGLGWCRRIFTAHQIALGI